MVGKLNIVREAGFNPIGFCRMFGVDCYVFQTEEEAVQAYTVLEGQNKVVGFWYGQESFQKEKKMYEDVFQTKVKIQQ